MEESARHWYALVVWVVDPCNVSGSALLHKSRTCRGRLAGAVRTRQMEFSAPTRSQNASYAHPADLWVQASLEQRQRFRPLFFPEGISFDGNSFVRTGVTAPVFSYFQPIRDENERMVD